MIYRASYDCENKWQVACGLNVLGLEIPLVIGIWGAGGWFQPLSPVFVPDFRQVRGERLSHNVGPYV